MIRTRMPFRKIHLGSNMGSSKCGGRDYLRHLKIAQSGQGERNRLLQNVNA